MSIVKIGVCLIIDDGSFSESNSQAQRADASYWNYGYNARGEVTSGKRYWQGGDPVSGMDFGYSFDDIGSRLSATVNGRQSAYATSNVNQYTSRTVSAWFDLFGLVATPNTTVAVNGNATVNVAQNFFHAMVSAANSSQPAFVPVTIVADDGTDPVSIEGNRFVPQSPEAFRYDADGNLLEDGRWLYTWDGENRLIAMQTRPEVIAAGTPGRRLTFGYDYMGRRVSKEVHAWHRNAWQPLHQRTFVYDGWNLIAERRADGSLIRTYTWGEDVSGSMQGAGGVGGLLAIHDHIENKTFVPAYDGNGNVIVLIDAATGTTAATYEYDPFGNLLLQEGAYALINPFRFSTKYTDNESGMLYYGYRYYNPDSGRWLSRDSIEEQGGVNMHVFVQNDGVNRWDYLGMVGTKVCEFCVEGGHAGQVTDREGSVRCDAFYGASCFRTNKGSGYVWPNEAAKQSSIDGTHPNPAYRGVATVDDYTIVDLLIDKIREAEDDAIIECNSKKTCCRSIKITSYCIPSESMKGALIDPGVARACSYYNLYDCRKKRFLKPRIGK